MKYFLIIFMVPLFLGCVTRGPEEMSPDESAEFFRQIAEATAQGNRIATEAIETNSEPVIIPLVEFLPPEENVGSPEPNSPTADIVVNQNRSQFTISPTRETFSGGAVVYNFVPNHIYRLFLATLRVVNLQLEPGETIIGSPIAGDTANFMLTLSHSMVNGRRQEHIFLKPLQAGRETTLVINTDRRTYHFLLTSFVNTYMPIVSFNYPVDSMQQMQREAARQIDNTLTISGRITDFDFNYDIVPSSVHRPSWMPSTVFNDGQRTYINFASAQRAAFAPVLFSIENGVRVIVNYRVSGSYYIVDSVLEHAELILDVNQGNIVTIRRRRR